MVVLADSPVSLFDPKPTHIICVDVENALVLVADLIRQLTDGQLS